MSEHQARFQALLRELFQFDSADLDFGIYRIMNHKQDVIERYIAEDLPKRIEDELSRGALLEQRVIARQLGEVQKEIREVLGRNALDSDGNLQSFARYWKESTSVLSCCGTTRSCGSRKYCGRPAGGADRGSKLDRRWRLQQFEVDRQRRDRQAQNR